MKKFFIALCILSVSIQTTFAFNIEFQETIEEKDYVPKMGGEKLIRESGEFDRNIQQGVEQNALFNYEAWTYRGFKSSTDVSKNINDEGSSTDEPANIYARRIDGLPLNVYTDAPDIAYQAYLLENGKVVGVITGQQAKNVFDSLAASHRTKQRSH